MAKKSNNDTKTSAPSKGKTSASTSMDTMSQCVTLCQEERWREAVVAYRKMLEKAQKAGNDAMVTGMTGALLKIEYSLRRQMAASAVNAARELLNKEYLLDV